MNLISLKSFDMLCPTEQSKPTIYSNGYKYKLFLLYQVIQSVAVAP
jgi:hypothetical protein